MSDQEFIPSDALVRFLMQAIAEKRRFSAELEGVFPEVVEVLPLRLKAYDSDPSQLTAFIHNHGVFSLQLCLFTYIEGVAVSDLDWRDDIEAFARALADETITPEDFMRH